jgi:hypothetical protein
MATLAVAMFYPPIDKYNQRWYTHGSKKNNGNERDKYLLSSKRELRVGATQPPPRREIHPRASAISANGGPR